MSYQNIHQDLEQDCCNFHDCQQTEYTLLQSLYRTKSFSESCSYCKATNFKKWAEKFEEKKKFLHYYHLLISTFTYIDCTVLICPYCEELL